MSNAWSDDGNSSVSSLDNEDDKLPTEFNNEFDACFKNGDGTAKTSTGMKHSLILTKTLLRLLI